MDSIVAGGHGLEIAWHGPSPAAAPTLVFLHEGLGCVEAWRDVPAALAATTGCGALVYSRAGYGASDPVPLPRPLDYMQDEGERVLPEVLAAAGVRQAILVGHSDGGSIAIAYAGSGARPNLRGLVLEAPHVICEELSVASIARARERYETGDLRERLLKYHRHVDVAFRGWCDAWLDPRFRAFNLEHYLPHVRVPTLLVQGEADPYGTRRQIDIIAHAAPGPTETLLIPGCGHAPHREARDLALPAIRDFVARL